jgi:hypothetical protein
MSSISIKQGLFQIELLQELEDFLAIQAGLFPDEETLHMDMHCHDHNSDVPDELLGRILNVPET